MSFNNILSHSNIMTLLRSSRSVGRKLVYRDSNPPGPLHDTWDQNLFQVTDHLSRFSNQTEPQSVFFCPRAGESLRVAASRWEIRTRHCGSFDSPPPDSRLLPAAPLTIYRLSFAQLRRSRRDTSACRYGMTADIRCVLAASLTLFAADRGKPLRHTER